MQGLQVLWRNDLEFELKSIKKWNLKVIRSIETDQLKFNYVNFTFRYFIE